MTSPIHILEMFKKYEAKEIRRKDLTSSEYSKMLRQFRKYGLIGKLRTTIQIPGCFKRDRDFRESKKLYMQQWQKLNREKQRCYQSAYRAKQKAQSDRDCQNAIS